MYRWKGIALVLLTIAMTLVIGISSSGVTNQPASAAATSVQPMEPEALAFGRSGELYLIDSQRDQVLASQSPYHSFTVFAGSGTRGFSGDGGPATMAKLSLSFDSGIAVASTGSVYLVDSANKRIREVLQNGEIETVARGGTISLEQRPTPARQAQFDPAGVTIGPNGDLYVAARQGAYELTPSGILDWIVGKQVPIASWAGWEANPSGENDFENAVQVAFDREGDLFVAGGGAQGLYERTTAGALRFVGVDRGPVDFSRRSRPDRAARYLGRPTNSRVTTRMDAQGRLRTRCRPSLDQCRTRTQAASRTGCSWLGQVSPSARTATSSSMQRLGIRSLSYPQSPASLRAGTLRSFGGASAV